MRQNLWRAVETGALSGGDGLAEIFRVPIDDDCGQQVQACHSIVLPFSGAVADFALTPDAQSILQGVMRLAFPAA